MQSSGRDNRIDVHLLMQEEADPIDDLSEVGNEANESDQDQLAELTAKHENLRRQVALLKAQLAEAKENKTATPDIDLRNDFNTRAVAIGVLTLGAGVLGPFLYKRFTA